MSLEKNRLRSFAAKGFVILMAVLLVFTVISRISDSFFVTQVSVEQPSSKKIEHIVETEGSIETGQEIPILTEAGLLMKSVYVKEGENVEQGTVLAEVLADQLQEQINQLSDEITTLQLLNEAAETNAQRAAADREKQITRAREDYDAAVAALEAAKGQANKELQNAAEAINSFAVQAAAEGFSQTECEEKNAALYQAYFEKQAACEKAEQDGQNAIRAAERALEDAKDEQAADNTVKINELSIAAKKEKLQKLVQLQQDGGKITASQKGTITGVFLETGQMSTETAAFTMAQTGEQLQILAVVSEKDIPYVEKGDEVTVQKSGKDLGKFYVSSIKFREDESYEVYLENENSQEKVEAGERVSVTFTKQSELYPLTVPSSAVHTEQGKHYVYVIREEETVLGTQLFTQKIEVQIAERNTSYAAISGGAVNMTDQVVTDSDSYISAGARVRLRQP